MCGLRIKVKQGDSRRHRRVFPGVNKDNGTGEKRIYEATSKDAPSKKEIIDDDWFGLVTKKPAVHGEFADTNWCYRKKGGTGAGH